MTIHNREKYEYHEGKLLTVINKYQSVVAIIKNSIARYTPLIESPKLRKNGNSVCLSTLADKWKRLAKETFTKYYVEPILDQNSFEKEPQHP